MSTFGPGQIVVPSELGSHNGAAIDILTQAVLYNFTTHFTQVGGFLPAHGFAFKDISSADGNLYLYDLSYTLTNTVALFSTPYLAFSPITSDYTNTYYAIRNNGTMAATLKTVTSAGVVGGTTYTLTGTVQVGGIGVSPDGHTLYYCDHAVGGALKRWDLQGNAALPDLVAARANGQYGYFAMCLPSTSARAGDVIVCFNPDHLVTAWQVERYTPSGVLAQTYIPVSPGTDPIEGIEMSVDPTYPNTFWIRTFDVTGDVSTFLQYSLDGTIMQSVAVTTTADPNTPSPSCPIFGWSPTLSPAPPSGPFAPDNGQTVFIGTAASMPIRRERTFPLPIAPSNARTFLSRLELQFQPGTGTPSDPLADPKFFVQVSWDNGKTWSNERLMSTGREGAYLTRAFVNILGSGREPVVRVVTTDTFVPVLTDCFIWTEGGLH